MWVSQGRKGAKEKRKNWFHFRFESEPLQGVHFSSLVGWGEERTPTLTGRFSNPKWSVD